jgi:dUTPase
MNKLHTDTHMQKPDHTRLPTYTHTHMNTHKSMRAYTHTQTLIHTGIHINICSRTCMHTHALSYTPTNHETSQIFTNTQTDARACVRVRTHTHAQAHIRIMRMDMQWAPLLYTHCSPPRLTRTSSFSSADDPMTRCGGLGLRGEMATPMRQGVWCLLPVVLNAVPIHTQCSDHYLRDQASWL